MSSLIDAMPALDPWGRARLQTGEALTNSAGLLLYPGSARQRWPGSPSMDPLARPRPWPRSAEGYEPFDVGITR